MSRQFGIYLLPSDVDFLVAELGNQLDVKVIRATAPNTMPVEVFPSSSAGIALDGEDVATVRYLVPPDRAEILMRYIEIYSHWSVQIESEVIEFSGCKFDGKTLVRGRFYFQNDRLIGDRIVPKRQEFLDWADQVFRIAKKVLRRSKSLDAYVGPEAEKWRAAGGRFVELMIPGREPVYAEDLSSGSVPSNPSSPSGKR
jgi:hypothetical protein